MASKDGAFKPRLLSEREGRRNHDILQTLVEFSRLFDYAEASDRAIAIVGPAFLDALLTEILGAFMVADEKELARLMQPEGLLGTFGAKVTACYCLGLIGKTVKGDSRLVAKIRNRFAHDLRADFADARISGWCKSLAWHQLSMFHPPPSDATDRDLFQVGVNQLVSHLHGLVSIARFEKREEFQPGYG